MKLAPIFYTCIALLSATQVSGGAIDAEGVNMYNLIKKASKTVKALRHANGEVKDRFTLLRYLFNNTIAYKVYEIQMKLLEFEPQPSEVSVHYQIVSSRSAIDLNLQSQLNFSSSIGGYIEDVLFDLLNNLDDLAIDFAALKEVLPSVNENYWRNYEGFTTAVEDLKTAILSTIENEIDPDALEVSSLLLSVENLLVGERVGIEEAKSALDNKAVDMQIAVQAVIERMSPYV